MKNETVHFKYRVAAIAMHQGHVLIHRFEGSDYWSLPGGNIELGETSQQALKRELLEEADLEIEIDRLIWTNENYFVRASGKQVHELCFYFLVQLNKEKTLYFEGREGGLKLHFRWVLLQNLPTFPLVPSFLKTRLQLLPGTTEHIITFTEKPVEDPV